MQNKIKTKKTANTFFESVAKVIYLGTTLVNMQYFMKKLREHCTQVAPDSTGTNFFFSGTLVSRDMKIRICRTVNFPHVLYVCEASTFSLNQVKRLKIITDEGVWIQNGLEKTG